MNRAHWSSLPDDWSNDEKLAGDFLAGWPNDEIDSPLIYRHFEPDSDEEKEAQAALVRVLRDPGRPLNWAIRVRIAALLDPTHQYETRKFVIENRPGAERRITESEIIAFIEEQMAKGCNVGTAVEDAAEKFGREPRTIWRVRERHEAKK
jgi:hypothetical protein